MGWSGNEVRMRSGDPGPDRPRPPGEGPDLSKTTTRNVPTRGPPLRLSFRPLSPLEGARGSSRRAASHAPTVPGRHRLLGFDLADCSPPMLLMLAVRLPFRLPKGI